MKTFLKVHNKRGGQAFVVSLIPLETSVHQHKAYVFQSKACAIACIGLCRGLKDGLTVHRAFDGKEIAHFPPASVIRKGYRVTQDFRIIGRSGKLLAARGSKAACLNWIDSWVAAGYRNDFYNHVGRASD